MRCWLRRHWRLLVGGAVSALLLLLAFRGVAWDEVRGQLLEANWLFIVIALGSVLLTAWLKTIRWRLMFWPDHRALVIWDMCGIFFAGQVINAAIPTRMGELARALMLGQSQGVSKAHALWTAAVEKMLDAMVLLIAIVALSLNLDLPGWLNSAAWTLAVALSLVVVALVAAVWVKAPVLAWIAHLEQRYAWLARLRLQHLASVVLESLRQLRSPQLLGYLIVWSLLAFGASSGTNWLVARALGINLSIRACLLLLAVLQISAVVPIPTSPGRVGLYHTLCILVLAIFGMGQDVAVGYGLVLHLVVYLPMMILGPVAIWANSSSWRELQSMLRVTEAVDA